MEHSKSIHTRERPGGEDGSCEERAGRVVKSRC